MPGVSEHILETLRDDGELILSRNHRHGDPNPVLVLAPSAGRPAINSLRRLEHEYGLRGQLEPGWAARPLALERCTDGTVLVLEDPGGEPLDRFLGQPMEVTRFLRFAVGLAAAVGQVHHHGLIHKDIKPANVLVRAVTGDVWLTGFGLASPQPRERQAPEPPEVIAGTLAYMAPEQTGRMNRSIDSRSDLYAVGVTLYQMLTGTLPFAAADPMGWVHCHIAQQPAPPGDRVPGLPEPLAAIVMKLLAKTAEDRYQTAAGLEADLRHCLQEWERHCRIDAFALGMHDASDRLLIPEKLYGREREITALLAAFERVVARGAPELVLVSGYSGIGKSSVVNELHKALVPPRGMFAAGKFDQYKRYVPYTTLAQAFQTLVRQILGKSEAEVRRWRSALREALGANGQLIVNLIPELDLIIGKQPLVPQLPPQHAQKRFQMVFRRFLGAFARPEHPLALFLDDLQWLDTATLELIEYLITEPEVRHLLLVGAYRDNELGPSHPLMRMLESIRRSGAPVTEIVLTPLCHDDVGRLVADALHCPRAHTASLAELVHEKTAGNPFFAIQFLTALPEEALLAFDPGTEAWTWDMARIRAMGFTNNVVDLMVGKLNRLPGRTQEALGQLACLGNVADAATLAMVHGESENVIRAALWEAVRAGLVFFRDDACTFLHDRVREASYALIPEQHRAQVHLRIGRLLVAKMTPEEIADKLFDVVNQLNLGRALIADPDEKEQVAQLNLCAGRRAKASTAYASACVYLSAGMDLLGGSAWTRRYTLTFSLWLERAECEYLNGHFETTEGLIAELLDRAASNVDKAAAYRLRILFHVMNAEYRQAVDSGLTCLRLFGIERSAHPARREVELELEAFWRNLGERSVASLVDLPLMTDPDRQAAMRVLSVLLAPAHFTDVNLFYLLVCHMANASLEHGTTDASAHAFGRLGPILGPLHHRYVDGYQLGQLACALVEKYGFNTYKATAHFYMEMVAVWTQPIRIAIDLVRLAFLAAVETGDLSYACYSCNHLVTDLLMQGADLGEVWSESQKGLEFVRKIKFRDAADILVSQQRFILNMRGQTAAFSSFGDAEFDEQAFEARLTADRMPTLVCYYWILKLQARFMSGDYGAAIVATEKASALLWSSEIHLRSFNYYYYSALTIAAVDETSGPQGPAERREALQQSLQRLREWADSCPETFLDKYTLLAGEIARIEGRDPEAMRLYEQAIHAAHEHGFVHDEGLANELAARFYAARGFATIAHTYLRNARSCYLRWGASGKVRQLDRSTPHLQQAPASLTATIGTPVEQLDVGTVVKASQAVSGEIVLEKLIATLMRIAVEHAGAERGLLILLGNDEPRIEAEATTGSGRVEVTLRQAPVTAAELSQSVLHFAIRTRESMILDDASAQNQYSADPYIARTRPRSVLCLPLMKQAEPIGVLYLENNLVPGAFTPERIAVLELLASQAVISLENARLYADLQKENSERKRAEAARLDSEQRFRDYAETASDWFWETGPEHDFTDISGKYDVFGMDRDVAIGRHRTSLAADLESEPEKWREHLAILERHEPFRNFEYKAIDRLGRVRHLSVSGRPIFDAGGRFMGYRGTTADLTEQREAEGKLHQSQKMEAVGQLTGGVAHDFNNILTVITGTIDVLIAGVADRAPLAAIAQMIDEAATRGADLTHQLLAFARKQALRPRETDINALIIETARLLRPTLGEQIEIESMLDENAWRAMIDPTQLSTALLNLAVNARDAMRDGGKLRLETGNVILGEADARANADVKPGTYVVIAVSDTGTGIPAAIRDKVFEPFFTTKEVGKGTGLGLSMVYGFVKQSGGHVRIFSEEAHGTTIKLYLPRSDEEAVEPDTATSSELQGGNETILVVEDDALVRNYVVAQLRSLGYATISAASGPEALALVDQGAVFDLLFTDVIMPGGMNGPQLADAIARRPCNVPVLYTSGYPENAIIHDGRLRPGVALLNKPYRKPDLARMVREVIARRAAPAAS